MKLQTPIPTRAEILRGQAASQTLRKNPSGKELIGLNGRLL
jgi:hypothetical protein